MEFSPLVKVYSNVQEYSLYSMSGVITEFKSLNVYEVLFSVSVVHSLTGP